MLRHFLYTYANNRTSMLPTGIGIVEFNIPLNTL